MSRFVPIAQAKARFAEFVRRAEAGETVVLTRHGRAVATLARAVAGGNRREPGDVGESTRPYGSAPSEDSTVSRVALEGRRARLQRVLEESIWPRVPRDQLGKSLGKPEREAILGYGEDGV